MTANGPMWRERVVAAPATELLISGLAAGRYELSAVQGGGQTGIGPAAAWVDVVNGGETLLSVVPCPP